MTLPEAVRLALTFLLGVMNASFTLYVITMAASLIYSAYFSGRWEVLSAAGELPALRIAILLPLYRERPKSVSKTVESLLKQLYRRDLVRVFLIIEEGDEETEEALKPAELLLTESGFSYRIVKARSTRRFGKSEALNYALKLVSEDVVVVFDADDDVPEDYLMNVARAIASGYDAVTTKVYRLGKGLHAKLLAIDTYFWYEVILKFFRRFFHYIPLSGEGLAVRREALLEAGGFPRKLTEDAYLTMLLAEKHLKLLYLTSEFIVEKAPKNFISQARQRLRWFQGYLECLRDIPSRVKGLGRQSFPLLILYFSPVVVFFTSLSYAIFTAYWVADILGVVPVTSFIKEITPPPIFYWGLTLLVLGNLFLMYYLLYVLAGTEFEELAPYVFILPAYWALNGVIAAASFVLPMSWRKTVR